MSWLKPIALAVYFLSGLAALMYQTIWQRMLTLFVGADIYSITIIVSAFMAGLGLGHVAGGYVADRLGRRGRPLAFAACELAIGVFALASSWIYYDFLYARIGPVSLPPIMAGIIVFVITLWPTFFMGLSLPIAARWLTDDARQPARWVPLLYGWNTVGGAAGAILSVTVVFRIMSFTEAVQLAAALSILCGIVALAAVAIPDSGAKQDAAPAPDASSPLMATSSHGITFRNWLLICGLSGFVALSLELVWLRILGVVLKANSLTFGYLLAFYLGGIGAGSIAATRGWFRRQQPHTTFLIVQAAIPIAAAVSLTLFIAGVGYLSGDSQTWRFLAEDDPDSLPAIAPVVRLLVPLYLIGPSTFLMGLGFGLLQRSVQTDLAHLGRRVGWLQTANVAGSALGTLLTGLVLLEWLGTAGTLRLLVVAAFYYLWWNHRAGSEAPKTGWVMGLAAAIAFATVPGGGDIWARLHGSADHLVIAAEGRSGLSLLKRYPDGPGALMIANGLGQSQLPFGGTHTALGALPALIHSNPSAIAIIGLGSGDTLFGAGARSETTRLQCMEIVAAEMVALRQFDASAGDAGLRQLLNDSRVNLEFTDGRIHLRRHEDRYDIIEADALRPTSAYAGNLYSVEFFELLRSRLKPGGLAVTWLPTERTRDTFIRVFPWVLVIDNIAIGSDSPIAFDPSTVRARMEEPFTANYFSVAGVDLKGALFRYLNGTPVRYGPDFDRSGLTDVNHDLSPKDEFRR